MYDSIYDYNFDGKLDSFELALKQVEEDRECAAIFGRRFHGLSDGLGDLDELDDLDSLDDGDF